MAAHHVLVASPGERAFESECSKLANEVAAFSRRPPAQAAHPKQDRSHRRRAKVAKPKPEPGPVLKGATKFDASLGARVCEDNESLASGDCSAEVPVVEILELSAPHSRIEVVGEDARSLLHSRQDITAAGRAGPPPTTATRPPCCRTRSRPRESRRARTRRLRWFHRR